MDDRRFDALTRRLATSSSRRGLLTGLTGILAGLAGLAGSRPAAAQPQTPCRALGQVCRPRPGLQCCPGTVCRAGRCACPRRQRRCRGRCIGANQCCGTRCPGGAVCRGGRCQCPAGTKRCQDRCLPKRACCRNRERASGQVCRNDRCRCAPGFQSCQGGCISDAACCGGCPAAAVCRAGRCCAIGTTAALQAALGPGGPATIQLCPDTAYVGSFLLSRDVTIIGAGASSSVLDGGDVAIVVLVEFGVTAELRGLGIRNGFGGPFNGGGVFNDGTLTLTGCRLANNRTVLDGGGMRNRETVILDATEVVSNSSGRSGAGISNGLGTVIMLDTSSVSGNTATSGNGGGIFYSPSLVIPGELTLAGSSVVAGNTAVAGGGIFVDTSEGPGTVSFADNACVRDNSLPQCVGTTCPVCP